MRYLDDHVAGVLWIDDVRALAPERARSLLCDQIAFAGVVVEDEKIVVHAIQNLSGRVQIADQERLHRASELIDFGGVRLDEGIAAPAWDRGFQIAHVLVQRRVGQTILAAFVQRRSGEPWQGVVVRDSVDGSCTSDSDGYDERESAHRDSPRRGL